MATPVLTVLLAVWSLLISASNSSISNSTQTWNRLLANYDKDEHPNRASGRATTVSLGTYINSLNVDEQNMEYSITMYFRQSWTDPRLDMSKFGLDRGKDLRAPEGAWDQIWTPDLFHRNAIRVNINEASKRNRMLKINKEGRIWYVQKLSLVLSNPMNFRRYPHDSPSLELLIESFGLTADDLLLHWLEPAVDISHNTGVPGLRMMGRDTHDCSQNYTAGTFSCLSISINFRRYSGYYVLAVYLPSAILVIFSWISFWIDRRESSSRLLLCLLTLVALIVMAGQARSSISHVSYDTSLDHWFIACVVFVFAAVLEYFVVLVLARMTRNAKGLGLLVPPSLDSDKTTSDQATDDDKGNRKALLVDWFSRILFPAVFVVFNLVYWIVNLQ